MYRVSGFRGSVRIIDFQLGDSPSFAYGKANDHGSFGPTFANYDVDDLHVAADGAFEFVLSGARRKDYRGDWVHEVDGRIAIERLDRPAARRWKCELTRGASDGRPASAPRRVTPRPDQT